MPKQITEILRPIVDRGSGRYSDPILSDPFRSFQISRYRSTNLLRTFCGRVGILGRLALIDLLVMPARDKQKLFAINLIRLDETIRRQFVYHSTNVRAVDLIAG